MTRKKALLSAEVLLEEDPRGGVLQGVGLQGIDQEGHLEEGGLQGGVHRREEALLQEGLDQEAGLEPRI